MSGRARTAGAALFAVALGLAGPAAAQSSDKPQIEVKVERQGPEDAAGGSAGGSGQGGSGEAPSVIDPRQDGDPPPSSNVLAGSVRALDVAGAVRTLEPVVRDLRGEPSR